jgi:hypothetical protein
MEINSMKLKKPQNKNPERILVPQLQEPTQLEETLPQELLNQRCDKCSARALILCQLPFGELYFCMHHYNEHSVALTNKGGVAKLLK